MIIIAYLILLATVVWLFGISVFIFARPEQALVLLGKFASTTRINLTELSLRMIAGAAFVVYAGSSRFPLILEIIGWFLVASAVILLLTPRHLHSKFAVFWSEKLTPLQARSVAPISVVAAGLLLYAIH